MGQSAAYSAKDHFPWVQQGGSTLGKMWVVSALWVSDGLRYGLLLLVRVTLSTSDTRSGRSREGKRCAAKNKRLAISHPDRKELACGSQAFIATLLFDPSMSALPIIAKQNSPRVGLFTH